MLMRDGHRAAARRRGCRDRRRGGRRRPAAARVAAHRSRTSRSSTSACPRPTPTRGSSRRGRSAALPETSACSSSPSTSTPSYAIELLEEHPERTGYLLKERVSDIAVLVDALQRIADGECVLDPTIVARLIARSRQQRAARRAHRREREVLAPDGRRPLERRDRRAARRHPDARSRRTSARSSASSTSTSRPTTTAAYSPCSPTYATDSRPHSRDAEAVLDNTHRQTETRLRLCSADLFRCQPGSERWQRPASA